MRYGTDGDSPGTQVSSALGIRRWAWTEFSLEIVYACLTKLSSPGKSDERSVVVVVGIFKGPVVGGSSCERERIETF